MPNFEARSAQQPDLDDVSNLVRFKGCYYLKAVHEETNANGWPIRIAIIGDVENTGELELRLLGDNFRELAKWSGDYVNLEAAVKRYNGGYFFYLAWAEVVTDLTSNVTTNFFDQAKENEHQELEFGLRMRCETIVDQSVRQLCHDILTLFGPDFNSDTLRRLLKVATTRHADELCVEMALAVSEIEKIDDLGFVGSILSNLRNQHPFEIWSSRLLGD
ncbi:hypothetical protein FJM67_15875 [Maribrevibacterium harenarium]|uniref:Uncharacterized protein n=1 Tax=Maribrevibacterium harenarium TaxID=2589817 RepID=A0A501WHN2_9GAMM|nr:hypothetical protein [Maribrevibacterium harenarium]TPE46597.1 hypothetical protein FJM67_15875 [Maribrevibacterium harenarium]